MTTLTLLGGTFEGLFLTDGLFLLSVAVLFLLWRRVVIEVLVCQLLALQSLVKQYLVLLLQLFEFR